MAPPRKYGEIQCANCGVSFRKTTAKRKVCSAACRDALRRLAIIEIVCETCGQTFSVRTRYLLDGPRPRRFCSAKCRQIGHRVLPTPENIAAKFWANVDKKGPDDCWNWKLAPGAQGYGIICLYKFRKAAHKFSYEFHFGQLPKMEGYHGACVLHECDNRLCVNPNHLFVGTQADNIHDMMAKGRMIMPNKRL